MRLIDADATKASIKLGVWASKENIVQVELIKEWIDHQPTVGGWINVQDRLPEYTGWYLTYHHKINLCVVSWFTGDGWEDGDWGAYEDGWVSHWMPLPEDPKEVDGDG